MVLDGRNAFVTAKGETRPVFAGENIFRGSTVETAFDSFLDLALLPGLLARVDSKSALAITDLKIAIDGNETADGMRERIARAQLRAGRMIVRLDEHLFSTSQLHLETSRAKIDAGSAALFLVDARADSLEVFCARGHVDVAPAKADHTSTIWPHERIRVDASGAHHASPDPIATKSDYGDCFRVEHLLQFEFEERRQLPPW
ncbi:MAG: hypothetical protein DLM52_10950 [Chthoniobacterales bacterium]|nr:MAG: hypothetical protein DLM52_10950 [Chthoniobacterales bacterium]